MEVKQELSYANNLMFLSFCMGGHEEEAEQEQQEGNMWVVEMGWKGSMMWVWDGANISLLMGGGKA
jgi:hypothetical protein